MSTAMPMASLKPLMKTVPSTPSSRRVVPTSRPCKKPSMSGFSTMCTAASAAERVIVTIHAVATNPSRQSTVLCLLGFVATAWIVTITLSAADAAVHIVENPLMLGFLHGREVGTTLLLLGVLGTVFIKGFKEAIGIAVLIVGAYLLLNLVVVAVGFYSILIEPQSLADWQSSLFAEYGNRLVMIGVSLLVS